MMASVAFAGFKPELPRFLKDLGKHNTREWFQAHYDGYQHLLVEPTRAFVLALVELCFDQYRQVAPLPQWLAEVLSA